MTAAALLRSVASKMSRAGAAPTHHRSLVARGRGLHGGARSGPATSDASSSSVLHYTITFTFDHLLQGPQTSNKKILSSSDWDRVKKTAIETTAMCACLTVIGGIAVLYRLV